MNEQTDKLHHELSQAQADCLTLKAATFQRLYSVASMQKRLSLSSLAYAGLEASCLLLLDLAVNLSKYQSELESLRMDVGAAASNNSQPLSSPFTNVSTSNDDDDDNIPF